MVPPFGKNLTATSLNNMNNNKKLSYSEKKGPSSKIVDQNENPVEGNEYIMINTNGEMVCVGGVVQKNGGGGGKVIDYEKKNQERILKMQEKKMMEMRMIEEERKKMIKRQEKLKRMVLRQAAEVRETKQTEEVKAQSVPSVAKERTTPGKKRQEEGGEMEEEDDKKQKDIMKKYYRSRYATFLKTLIEQNKKKEQQVEEARKIEERKRAKLKEEIGIGNVQSRFLESKEPGAQVIVEEQKKEKKPVQNKRGRSVAPDTMATTSNFASSHSKDEQSMEIQRIYQ